MWRALQRSVVHGGVKVQTRTAMRSFSNVGAIPKAQENVDVSATIAQAMEKEQELRRVRKTEHMPIRAVHLARKMDIVSLFQRLYTDRFKVSHFLHKDSVVLRLSGGNDQNSTSNIISRLNFNKTGSASGNLPTIETTIGTPDLNLSAESPSRRAKDKWVVYFDYGAVVFFNCDDSLTTTLIKHAKKYCSDAFDIRGHDEELLLVTDPAQKEWSDLKENNIRVQEIDHVNVQVGDAYTLYIQAAVFIILDMN